MVGLRAAERTRWPIALEWRSPAQRRLIRDVISDLARERAGRFSFGHVARVVHATAATTLPLGVDDQAARGHLLHLCRSQLDDPRPLQPATSPWARAPERDELTA